MFNLYNYGKGSLGISGHLVEVDFPEECEGPIWKLEGGVVRPSCKKKKK